MERKFDSMKQVAIFVTFAGFSRKMTDITDSVSFGRFPVRPLSSTVGYQVTGEVAKKLHDKRNPMLLHLNVDGAGIMFFRTIIQFYNLNGSTIVRAKKTCHNICQANICLPKWS